MTCQYKGYQLSNFSERLKAERKRIGLNQANLGAVGGVSKGAQLNYESGERSPSAEYLQAIAGAGIDVGYLLTGTRSTLSTNEVPASYRTLSGEVPAPADNDDVFNVPLMNTKGGMGPGHQQVDSDVVKSSFPFSRRFLLRFVPESHLHDLRLIQSGGQSMLGTINDGDFSLVDTCNTNHDIPGVFALEVHGLVYIKRVGVKLDGTKVVSSDNPDDPITEELAGDHQLKVLGRVVFGWNGRRF